MHGKEGPPKDWVDLNKEVWRNRDLSKIPIYESNLGFEFWTDVVEGGVTTSDPGIFFRLRRLSGRDIQYSYGELVVGSKSLILTNDQRRRSTEMPSFFYCRDTEGKITWVIERFFDRFTIPDNENFPWLRQNAPMKDVGGIESFESREEQALFLSILNQILRRFDYNYISAFNGNEADANVVIGEKLKAKLHAGGCIRSH